MIWHLPQALAAPRAARDAGPRSGAVPGAAAGAVPLGGPFRPIADEVRELERDRMIAALRATSGVQNRAAALIEMPLRTFVTKVKRYAISPSDWGGT